MNKFTLKQLGFQCSPLNVFFFFHSSYREQTTLTENSEKPSVTYHSHHGMNSRRFISPISPQKLLSKILTSARLETPKQPRLCAATDPVSRLQLQDRTSDTTSDRRYACNSSCRKASCLIFALTLASNESNSFLSTV